jgi:hypothetical protein
MKIHHVSKKFRGALGSLLFVFSLPVATFSQALPGLSLQFVNNSGYADSNVWINWQNGGGANPFLISYGTNQLVAPVAMGASVNLMDINAAGGFSISNLVSGGVYVSYGAPIPVGAAPNPQGSGDPSYNIRYQNFEVTRTGSPGDQGDLTAINFFTSTMSAKTYNGGTNGTLLQSYGYHLTPATIANQLSALVANSPAAVVYDSNSNFVRVIAPTSFGNNNYGPYESFTNYLQSVSQSGQMTTVSNFNAFNTGAVVAGNTNYNFVLNFQAAVQSDNTIVMQGEINTIVTPFGQSSYNGPSFSNTVSTIPGTDGHAISYAIYGSVASSNTTFTGGWSDFSAFCLANNIETNQLGQFSDAIGTTMRLAIGEITTGFLAGFIDSTNFLPGTANMLKDVPSRLWWDMTNIVAFSDVQTNADFFNQYANVIYTSSSNGVYGMPYSDRFVNAPLFNTVQYNSQNVDTLLITLDYLDFGAIPEMKANVFMILGMVCLYFVVSRRRIRAKSEQS